MIADIVISMITTAAPVLYGAWLVKSIGRKKHDRDRIRILLQEEVRTRVQSIEVRAN